jgi:hypothetical protein
MKSLLLGLTIVLLTFISRETTAQISPDSLDYSSRSPLLDGVSAFENIKSEKTTELRGGSNGDGSNDPTSGGMTLEYWGTREVYRKIASVNGLHIVLIYIPEEN